MRNAGKRYQPSPQLLGKIVGGMPTKSRNKLSWGYFSWQWRLVPLAALAVLAAVVGINSYRGRERAQQRVCSELADLHVATLASTTPVDVLSTDRHTVKPWFQGKIPFTFNLPELQGTEFSLLGGRITYLEQTPGAQLIYQIRKHSLSVFIFPERAIQSAGLPPGAGCELSSNIASWTRNGLRYFVIGDVNRNDLNALSKLLQDAG